MINAIYLKKNRVDIWIKNFIMTVDLDSVEEEYLIHLKVYLTD